MYNLPFQHASQLWAMAPTTGKTGVNSNGNIGLEKSNNFIEIQGVNTMEQLLNLEKNDQGVN